MNTYIDSDTGYLFNNVDSLIQRINLAINDLKKDYSVIEEKLSNIDKKLEKSRVEKIFRTIIIFYFFKEALLIKMLSYLIITD